MKIVKQIIKFLLVYTGVIDLIHYFITSRLPACIIWRYHSVLDIKDGDVLYASPSITVSPKEFERQIRYLSKRYNIISLDELVSSIKRGCVPRNSLVITFDDGYRDNYLYAYPILKKYRATATIYLTANCIGTNKMVWMHKVLYMLQKTQEKGIEVKGKLYQLGDRDNVLKACKIIGGMVKGMKSIKERDEFLDDLIKRLKVNVEGVDNLMLKWEDVLAMKKDGFSFGGHTLTHPNLPSLSREEMRKEIEESKKVIEERLGEPVILFSYPNGGATSHYNEVVKEVVQECGYVNATTSDGGVVDTNSALYAMPRWGVDNLLDMAIGSVIEKLN
ncbi:MAG: polysaccharide deacetylase family protein [bacterium]|nr:polysaccharide deacetylase family protein [bacterium]